MTGQPTAAGLVRSGFSSQMDWQPPAVETCDHCKESLEFYNNINRYFYIQPFHTLLGIIFGYRMALSYSMQFFQISALPAALLE